MAFGLRRRFEVCFDTLRTGSITDLHSDRSGPRDSPMTVQSWIETARSIRWTPHNATEEDERSKGAASKSSRVVMPEI